MKCRIGHERHQKDSEEGVWGVREAGSQEKVAHTREVAHSHTHTHSETMLAALNVACRRKF